MCNCREKKGFALALSKAVEFEKNSNKEAAIFAKGDIISFTDRSNIGNVEGICCYFTTDSKEHKIVVAKKAKEIEVEDSTEVKPKRKRQSKSK